MEKQSLKQYSNNRKSRAKEVLKKGKPEVIDENTYLVPSQFDSNKKYRVTHLDSYSCDCPDFQKRCKDRGLYCKHIQAIILHNNIKTAIEMKDKAILEKLGEEPERDCCPYCKSLNFIKRGVRKSKTNEKQRFSCKDCKRKFVLEPIKRIKGNAKLISVAMDLYYKGNSLRDVSDHFKQFYSLEVSHETVRDWILRFTRVMKEYSKTLKPEVSNKWGADEQMVRTKKKGEFLYNWNVLDTETKFLISNLATPTRDKYDAKNTMTNSKEQVKELPVNLNIITDKNPSYQDGIRKAFRNWGNERKVKHTSIVGKRKEVNNNIIENYHQHFRDFDKTRKGFTEVQTYSDGYNLFHNFIRKGIYDKLTPSERAKLFIITQQNRWGDLLEQSLKNKRNNTKTKAL